MVAKKRKPKSKFVQSPHIEVSPMSTHHPAHPVALRLRKKPPITPVMRPIFHPPSTSYTYRRY